MSINLLAAIVALVPMLAATTAYGIVAGIYWWEKRRVTRRHPA
ncbi:hypothetical protein [Nocardia tengchongensis]